MKTFLFRPFSWFVLLLVLFTACEENNPYATNDNWQEENEKFIAKTFSDAQSQPGTWQIIKAWNLIPDGATDQPTDPQKYIYVKVLKSGTGTVTPLYTDSVDVNYRGKYYNEKVFDQSYETAEPDHNIVSPAGFRLSKLVVGFSTALQHMHEGDRWLVYIPWELGYGKAGNSSIPGYSNLIFDIDLVKITH